MRPNKIFLKKPCANLDDMALIHLRKIPAMEHTHIGSICGVRVSIWSAEYAASHGGSFHFHAIFLCWLVKLGGTI